MLDSRFLQLVMWVDCNSHCAFCLNRRGLANKDFHEDKIENINKALDIVRKIEPGQYDFIGLIGGEFFQGQITEDVAPHYKELVAEIKDKIDKKYVKQLFVASSLMGPDNYAEFQKYFSAFNKSEILVCTSYNTWGQFGCFPESNWQNNYKLFTDNGYQLHIEIIASESNLNAIIEGRLNLLPWVRKNIRIDFLRPIDFINEPKQKFPCFFPKRETFIKFMMFLEVNFPMMLDDFMSLKQRASLLHNFTFDQKVERKEEFNEGEGYVMKCGHSSLFKAYIDCDKCMACDIISFTNKRNKYRTVDKELPQESKDVAE